MNARTVLNSMANPAVSFLLRSPLHGMMSGGVLLMTVAGRRTGRRYTFPVQYHREGDTITIISRRERTWWRNLRGGAPVTLRVRGHDLPAKADVSTDAGEVRAALDATMPSRADRLAADAVLVRVRLEE